MIEKLKTPKSINWSDTGEGLIQRHTIIDNAYEKINELVDAVNELQTKVSTLEEQAHPIAEPIKIPCKRKLKEITFEDDWYKEKEIEIEFIPDDGIIYKGGNNE